MIIKTVKKYDDLGRKIFEKSEVEFECACMVIKGEKNPKFTYHSEFECYGTDFGVLKA